jgi:FtsP/CotA-like multicopper oxidase with cupredoxin domain
MLVSALQDTITIADMYLCFCSTLAEGSSAIQTLAGMAGTIIIEDESDVQAIELTAMRELVVVLQEIDMRRLNKLSTDVDDVLLNEHNSDDTPIQFITANGQFQPVIQLHTGEAIRLRIVHAGSASFVYLQLSVGADCVLQTIARDGAYHSEPRSDSGIFMSPGSRADAILQCYTAGTFSIRTGDVPSGAINTYLGGVSKIREQTLVFLTVQDSSSTDSSNGDVQVDEVMSLPTTLPAFEKSLIDAAVSDERKWIYEYNQGDKVKRGDKLYTFYGINGIEYNTSYVQRTIPLGAIEEWQIVNAVHSNKGLLGGDTTANTTHDQHPFHMHVNPYQIVGHTLVDDSVLFDWRVGDWRDTIR